MAITGTKAFTSGEVLTANDVNQYLMRGVKVFGGTAIRDAAYGGAGEPVLEEGEACYLSDLDRVQVYGGTAAGWVNVGPTFVFNTRTVVTATNASWPVPTLKSPIVRVTVIGGGGAGGRTSGGNGNAGGTTTFASGEAFAVAAAGGTGGLSGASNTNGLTGTAGFAAGNHGGGGDGLATVDNFSGHEGFGGEVKIAYCDLTGKTTLNLIIGAGGAAAASSGAGGRGEIIVEYAA
mgnify:CR=1 FL=1